MSTYLKQVIKQNKGVSRIGEHLIFLNEVTPAPVVKTFVRDAK